MSTRQTLLGLALLLALPAWAGLKIQHWTTTAGARVYFVEHHELPLLDVSVTFPAGSARDLREHAGLAAMTHALMRLGAGVWSEQEIAEHLAEVGAILSGHFDPDRAGFSLRTLSSDKARKQALSVLHAVLTAPHFEAKILKREQARAVAALKEAATRPQYIGLKAFKKAVYSDHPYALDESGEIDTIKRLDRADLVAFYRRYYRAANASIAIVGDISRDEAERLAEDLTKGLPSGEASPPIPPVRTSGRATAQVIPYPATQSHLFMGQPGLKYGDPDFFPLVVGNYILGGGGFDSRIMNEVRQRRGLAYSAYSAFEPMQELGPFIIGLQTRREATDDALQVVRETLAQFLRDGPTEAELAQAKNYLVGSFPLRLDSNRKILDHLAVMGFYRLPLDWLNHYASRVEAVTREDILRAFRSRIRPEAMHVVIVGGQLEAANR